MQAYTTHIVITELNDSSPQLASHVTYMNFSINLKCFYSIAPVLYQSINYIVNQFKAMNVFVSIQMHVHCCTTELKLSVVSSKLISFGILMKSLKIQYRFSQLVWQHVNHKISIFVLHYNGTRSDRVIVV